MSAARRWGRALAVAIALVGACGEDDTAVEHGCRRDADCPRPEMRCVAAAGVCVGFTTPLEAHDAGAASPPADE